MTERRVDVFTGRSVLIAPGRRGLGASRPGGLPEPHGRCPFCPAHEADTERTIACWPDEEPWQVRVVANKYPVVAPGYGASGLHEVGIDARAHEADLATLSADHVAAMLRVYRDRLRALESAPGIASTLLFRNRGRRAGSSQPHPHTQLAALEWVPGEVALRWAIAREHHARAAESVLATALARELDEGTRILAACERFVVHCPYAPTRPFEVRIAPRASEARFSQLDDDALAPLAAHLVSVYARLRAEGIADDNLVLRQPPLDARLPAASWHFDVLPRRGGDAGFELATGEMIVVVSPEEAAARLRERQA